MRKVDKIFSFVISQYRKSYYVDSVNYLHREFTICGIVGAIRNHWTFAPERGLFKNDLKSLSLKTFLLGLRYINHSL